jgi:hypothetical protein
MTKIEHGSGILISIDTDKRTLRLKQVVYSNQPPAKEWEHPYTLEWTNQQFFDFVGKHVEYVLSDGAIVNLISTP